MQNNTEDKLTQEEVWDEIASLWNKYKVIPFGQNEKGNLICDFIDKKDNKILDLGCGSGRNFSSLINCGFNGRIYGVDFSQNMLDLAKENAEKLGIELELKKANTWETGYEDNFFDKIICIATIHCILRKEDRQKTLEECYRLLRKNGKLLITSWNKANKRWRGTKKERMVSWSLEEKETGKKVYRHYYIYDTEELISELENVGFKIVKRNFGTGRNIIIIVSKD